MQYYVLSTGDPWQRIREGACMTRTLDVRRSVVVVRRRRRCRRSSFVVRNFPTSGVVAWSLG